MVKNWQLRRTILAWEVDEDIRLACVIALEHFDWNTGRKVFDNKHAFTQWYWGLGQRYNINPRTLKEAVMVMKEAGAIVVTPVGETVRVFTLAEPTNTQAALAAYKIRKDEKEQNNE